MSALEYEYEVEGEYEGEEEVEGEEFLGALLGTAARALAPQARALAPQLLRRVGPAAARTALRGGMQTLGLGESEEEGESEGEAILSPIRRVYPDAMMEHFGHAASQARSEAEAEAFIGALIPLAARLVPRVAPAIVRAAPGLIRGVAGITRTLRATPATRPLVRTVPTIVRRTARDLARQTARGRQPTPQQAVRTLARQANRVLSNPQQCRQALQRNAAVDRRYHQAAQSCPNCLAE
jgi:hypothetical protein